MDQPKTIIAKPTTKSLNVGKTGFLKLPDMLPPMGVPMPGPPTRRRPVAH